MYARNLLKMIKSQRVDMLWSDGESYSKEEIEEFLR